MQAKKNYIIGLIVFSLFSSATYAIAATQAQYNAMPPFLSSGVPPNVMFMLDNSGSMKNTLAESEFDPTQNYYGLFEDDKKYKYDNTIKVDLNGYNGLPYDIDADGDGDTDSNDVYAADGAFVEDNTCTIGIGNNCWNGKFLNWMVTRRIDAARKVMVGGKVEERNGYDYIGGDGGDLEWKIVANNERSDPSLDRTYSSSGSYTPYSSGSAFTIASPAEAGANLAKYDPYAKLKVLVPAIVNSAAVVIGEYGTIPRCGPDAGADNWYTVSLTQNYTDPVVVAGPLAYYGSDPSVSRIKDIDAAVGTFKIRVEEWEYKDGSHTGEDISYIVFEKGTHTLSGGQIIVAGTVDIDTTDASVDISAAGFVSAPVIFSSIVTNNGADTVTTRQKSITKDGFSIKLQEEEAEGIHVTETVSYIALNTGSYGDGGNIAFQVGIKAGVDENWETISFTGTSSNPSFFAAMQTTNDNDPAALRYNNLETDTVDVFVEEEQSNDSEINHSNEDVGYMLVYPNGATEFNLALIVEEEPKGLLHDISDKVRLGISLYNYKKDGDIYNSEAFHGGTMKPSIPLNPFVKNAADTTFRSLNTPINADIEDIVDAIEHYPLVWGTTPLSENYYEVIRYFQQEEPYYPGVNGAGESYDRTDDWDPYYFESILGDVSCVKSYVLVFTDGEPYRDDYVPCYVGGATDSYSGAVPADDGGCTDYDGNHSNSEGSANGSTSNKYANNLDDLALWAHSVVDQSSYVATADRDLRSDIADDQNLITYTVGFGSDTLKQILVDTAANGGGQAYAAENGRELKNQLTSAFTDILSRSSGTSASVISNTRSGEGAIYQSVFFPNVKDGANEVSWVGQVHALLVDAYGNMREDTNGNGRLDLEDDYFVIFNEDGTAVRYIDFDGDQSLENTSFCPLVPTEDCRVSGTIDLDDLNYLWNTSKWLNEISDSNVEIQRPSYISSEGKRYIFTWVDDNGDGKVDNSEVIDFISPNVLSDADLKDPDQIYPYLNLYPSFADTPAEISSLSAANLKSFLKVQTKRQINYIRGSDCVDPTDVNNCNTKLLEIASIEIPGTAMRSRQFDYDGDSTIETWRLGDIVYSTPTLVGRPAENLHLLYRDLTYASFVAQYNNRRQVVYAGSNDGMLHAFNAGFYNPDTKQFCRSSDFDDCNDASKPALGAELWAYVPFNLLPHLYWLTQTSYDDEKHVYYVDQKPRIFDAKIFAADAIHPGGWGTVMVVGMNLGGGSIIADIDKTDGAAPDTITTDGDGIDPTMKSAFIIFDITNPEAAPKLLAELTMPQMGFSTSYPTVVAMKDGDHDGNFEDYAAGENRWYLGFGSGPADAAGDPGTVSTLDGGYDNVILNDVKSLQPGRFFLLDLVKLGSSNELFTLQSDGTLYAGLASYDVYDSDASDSNTFISAPVSVDYDLDYNTDAIYFGTISGTSKPWAGKLRRIVIDDKNNPADWISDNVLIDVEKPISAAPAIGVDDDGRNWVFFGTGRYFGTDDQTDMNRQGFYGLKEPLALDGTKSWATLNPITDLIDTTDFTIYSNLSVDGVGVTDNNWAGLITDQSLKKGWYLQFSEDTGERNLGQAALIGGLLSFTTFIPESDICSAGGESFLWALYYETGTAHHSGILGTIDVADKDKAIPKISLGQGLAASPNIHIGSEKGSTVFVQSSTSEITQIKEENPLNTKSGIQSWRLQD